jgi:hypothetical protein
LLLGWAGCATQWSGGSRVASGCAHNMMASRRQQCISPSGLSLSLSYRVDMCCIHLLLAPAHLTAATLAEFSFPWHIPGEIRRRRKKEKANPSATTYSTDDVPDNTYERG